MRSFDQLIADAESFADKTSAVDFDVGHVYAQASIAYSLIAIAQELKKFNDREDLEGGETKNLDIKVHNLHIGKIKKVTDERDIDC